MSEYCEYKIRLNIELEGFGKIDVETSGYTCHSTCKQIQEDMDNITKNVLNVIKKEQGK